MALAVLVAALGCGGGAGSRGTAGAAGHGMRPDVLPVMVNAEPPFRYPMPLYERKVQGDVMLRIYIDAEGRVRPESTTVSQPSGFPALDSAALTGAASLQFRPATAAGRPVAVAILLPVHFRHPDAAPLPGDGAVGHRQR